jgi:hypothetical protein
MPKSEPKKVGRPSTITPEEVAKLEHAYLMDANDAEAALYAGVSKDAVYRYMKQNPKFREKSELLRNSVKFKAKTLVAMSIESGDADMAKWLLERRARAEFSTRQETTGADGGPIQTTIDTSKLSDKAMEELLNATKDQLDE